MYLPLSTPYKSQYRSETKVLDFSSLVRERCADFAESMALKCSIEDGCCMRGHSDSLLQMIDVLLDNAFRYRTAGSTVKIQLRSIGKHLELSIENEVEHLPSGYPDELFERFSRGDSLGARPYTSGCGVGLSAAQTIVKLHRGSICICYPNDHLFRVNITMPSQH